MHNTIAIVGGGFSGTVLAANLLRGPPTAATDIVLIERGGEMGRGVAYAERDYPYLLNVPAVRLSADSADPPSIRSPFREASRIAMHQKSGRVPARRGINGLSAN